MDVQCARTFLQEMRIGVEDPDKIAWGWNAFLLPLHGMDEHELSVAFRSATHHFEGGGNSANLFFMGKRDIPGVWVDMGDAACVSSFVAVIHFESAMLKANFVRYLCNWLKKQRIPEQVVDKVARQSRVFTTRECDAMGIRLESPVEVDAGVWSDFERLRQIAKPENEQESRELLELLGKFTEWMEDNDLPDEFFELPADQLIDAVTHYSTSSSASASMLTDGLTVVDRNAMQICDAAPEVNTETPALVDEPDDHVDSCDELERELIANQEAAPTNSAEQFRLQRQVHEPAGYMLYKTSVELPVLTAYRPRQTMSTDDVAEILVTRFHKKHGKTEPSTFKDGMLQIAGCLQEAVNEGRVAQKDRLSTILPPLTATYKKLFGRNAPSTISNELRGEISRILLHSKCKNCGQSLVPSDQSLYDSDANGVEVVVGQRSYNSREFCEERCEQRWQCFRCLCGRPLQKGRLGWLDSKCSMCRVGRPVFGRLEMDYLRSGLFTLWTPGASPPRHFLAATARLAQSASSGKPSLERVPTVRRPVPPLRGGQRGAQSRESLMSPHETLIEPHNRL